MSQARARTSPATCAQRSVTWTHAAPVRLQRVAPDATLVVSVTAEPEGAWDPEVPRAIGVR